MATRMVQEVFLCYRHGVRTYEVTHIRSTYLTSWLTGRLWTVWGLEHWVWLNVVLESIHMMNRYTLELTHMMSQLTRSQKVCDEVYPLSRLRLILESTQPWVDSRFRESTQLSRNVRERKLSRTVFELIWIQKRPRMEGSNRTLFLSLSNAFSLIFSLRYALILSSHLDPNC